MQTRKVKINWTQPRATGNRTGWARSCVALTQLRGARGLVGDYLMPGEQLLEVDTIIVEVKPMGAIDSGLEVARILRVTEDGLQLATFRIYQWRTELVSLREKIQELLEAPQEGYPERYPSECDQSIADGLPTHVLVEALRRRNITSMT
jgi:hypothetical protein